ncbi:hypothetical protein Glove_478g96 [Diversispora epigaea]|uniref:Uncharacterized protein n=1 Tax=Diversispora epigaea TaxID=1348612 RepID=A0A397GQY4_9GLOM|nr:hypothetical protein Glove_478g96 [Diversispora epigaea]
MTFTDRQQKKKLERRRSRQLYREQRPRLNLNQALEEINWNIRSRENSLTRLPVSFSVQTSVETTRENFPEQSNDEESEEIVEEENIEEQELGGLREYLQEFEIEEEREIQEENNKEPIIENNDQRKERIYTVLDDAVDKWYNEIYTATYRNDKNELST